jgi:hypothetical protein
MGRRSRERTIYKMTDALFEKFDVEVDQQVNLATG